jgi:hypothetical protein
MTACGAIALKVMPNGSSWCAASSMSAIATLAPSRAMLIAVCLHIPLATPVISATLPTNLGFTAASPRFLGCYDLNHS